ncbi:DUF2288 domain-containing protein [Microcoleus sp. FACHB-672]|uniref:DUF2288 domain-containing protein n=1 Tax=Microcoleus sp. FACHB-672 TaxID=2692825 RepID=UPI0016834FAF|nr:DUF2288 domain-containing protein [Microcoleus sp. FACHB-672]MBD2043611.1 DUF2288 family protein [Microcoleus sp. FACHB-672]
MEDIKAELEEMLDEAEWNWLQPHADRQALVVVGQELDLIDVGVAIASDNVQSVQHWLGEQLIYKPSPEQVANWNVNRSKRFNTLIVQPFVLVQELAAA